MCTLFLLLSIGLHSFHTPHDTAHGVATAHLPGGAVETVITTHKGTKVLRTRDEGLSWQSVSGNGLQLARPDIVHWDAHASSPRFLIGANLGVWAYDPMTGEVNELNDGLTNERPNKHACQFSSPAKGFDGPVFMANKVGEVWRLNRDLNSWELVLETGWFSRAANDRAQVAVVPTFDASSSNENDRTVFAAFAGVLFVSRDGGDEWVRHSQFFETAIEPYDPLITSIAFAHDFTSSGNFVLATSVLNANYVSGDEGTLWNSSDFGDTFQASFQSTSSIRSLASSPVGPSGKQWFFASVLMHPAFEYLNLSTGILRSSDGGATWSDYGSAQDFIRESDASNTVAAFRFLLHDFEVSPDFANDGRIYFGRTEGLYYSDDEGAHWNRRSFRQVTHIRSVDSTINSAGEIVAFAGSYGSGTLMHNLSSGKITLLAKGPNSYTADLKLSPNFDEDGMLFVGGSRGPSFWYDPTLGASNPHQTLGWKSVPPSLRLGYTRAIAFSPNFDARGLPGTDQIFFFSTSTDQETNFVTLDGGLSVQALDKMTDGSPAPDMWHLAVAPTFNEKGINGSIDVYGVSGRVLYRLEKGKWDAIYSLPGNIKTVQVDPAFDRDPLTPGLPRLFIALRKDPYFVEYLDYYGSPVVREFANGLEGTETAIIRCPSHFEESQTVYMATFLSGVKRLDLLQPSPTWTAVGQDFPEYLVTDMALSTDDNLVTTIMVGTHDGLVVGRDVPGGVWVHRKPSSTMDDDAPSFRFFQPGEASNPDPERTWNWDSLPIEDYQDSRLEFTDTCISYTTNDGSYFDCAEYAGGIVLHSFLGPNCGQVNITVENYWTGQPVASITQDLFSGGWRNEAIALDFPYQPVVVRVEADLDPGEVFYFDGMTFFSN